MRVQRPATARFLVAIVVYGVVGLVALPDLRAARKGEVELAIYAVDGTKVRTLATGRRDAGPYRILWDGRDDGDRRVASGTYFARLRTAQGNLVAKMVLLK